MIDSWEYAEDTRGTGFHSPRGFGGAGHRGRATHLERMQHGATLLGISLEAYIAHREAGEAWCSGHKAWHARDQFGTTHRYGEAVPQPYCFEINAQRAKEAYQRKKAKRTLGGVGGTERAS